MEALVKAGAFDFTGELRAVMFAKLEQVLASAASMQKDKKAGQGGLFDDFENFGAVSPLATATTYFQSNGNSYLAYNDATVVPTAAAVPSTTPSVSENGPGVIVMQSDTTANDIAILQAGSGTMTPFHVNPARMQELAFECRFKVSAITASCSDIFIGLAGTGACADSGVFTDAGALASNNFLGLFKGDG
jgi:hypothetical protein